MSEFSYKRSYGPTPRYERVQAYDKESEFKVIAGPCSLESVLQIQVLAEKVSAAGATHLRSGVFRAGTYPGKNFGLIDQTLISEYQKAAQANGLKNIIEVLDYTEYGLERVAKYCDVFQVGARQMQNYTLLRTLGQFDKPVFLKRNTGCTMDEFLGAAEHLLAGGVTDLTLIERGSSTHMNHVRWDLSVSIIPAIQAITKIPIIIDSAHGTGRRDLVAPMALAGVAAGANGILVEVHEDPQNSLSDPEQAITPDDFEKLMIKINKVREAIK